NGAEEGQGGKGEWFGNNSRFPCSPTSRIEAFLGGEMPTMATPNEHRNLAIRLLLSSVTTAIVFTTAYVCAWYESRGFIYFRYEQYETRRLLERLRDDIESFQETSGHPPARLADLEVVKSKQVRVDDNGCIVDGWDRPLQYKVQTDSYELYSYGRD